MVIICFTQWFFPFVILMSDIHNVHCFLLIPSITCVFWLYGWCFMSHCMWRSHTVMNSFPSSYLSSSYFPYNTLYLPIASLCNASFLHCLIMHFFVAVCTVVPSAIQQPKLRIIIINNVLVLCRLHLFQELGWSIQKFV